MSTSPSPTTPHPTQWDIPPIRWAFELLPATPDHSLQVYLPACPAHTLACPERSLLHTNAILLLLASHAPCAQPLLRIFPQLRCSAFSFSPRVLRARNCCCEFFHLPPPSASQTKRRCVQRPCLPTAAALLVSKEMGLHRNSQSVVACNKRPRVETAAPLTAVVDPKGQPPLPSLWQPGDQADDRLRSVRMRPHTAPQRRVLCR